VRRREFVQLIACSAAGSLIALRSLAAGTSQMTTIDSQVHAYEANTPKRPWHGVPNWPAHVTGDEMVAAMDKVGVAGGRTAQDALSPGNIAGPPKIRTTKIISAPCR
jgi:hypothetical protein